MNVYDQAHALKTAIQGSEEFKQYAAAKSRMEAQPELAEMLRDYQAKQLAVQGKQMLGEDVTNEMLQQVQNLYQIMAASALKRKEVQKIILARPAVEAGESLGFLPGDLQEKVDPYLRPLYDALYDIMGRESTLRLKEKEIIEIVPLAYMRGRTLDNSFIILDEAQNTTKEQMKMFLTRMGFDSRVVVTGDITQIDLPKGRKSGLIEVTKILRDIPDIEFCFLKDVDVVRHETEHFLVLYLGIGSSCNPIFHI